MIISDSVHVCPIIRCVCTAKMWLWCWFESRWNLHSHGWEWGWDRPKMLEFQLPNKWLHPAGFKAGLLITKINCIFEKKLLLPIGGVSLCFLLRLLRLQPSVNQACNLMFHKDHSHESRNVLMCFWPELYEQHNHEFTLWLLQWDKVVWVNVSLTRSQEVSAPPLYEFRSF